ncbi:hypothetical protein D3C78_1728040 [compost metagenome]
MGLFDCHCIALHIGHGQAMGVHARSQRHAAGARLDQHQLRALLAFGEQQQAAGVARQRYGIDGAVELQAAFAAAEAQADAVAVGAAV